MKRNNIDSKKNLQDFFKTPLGAGILLLLMVFIGLIIITIVKLLSPASKYNPVEEVDPTTGEVILFNSAEPEEEQEPLYIGFADLLTIGFPYATGFDNVKDALTKYTSEALSESLVRASMVPESAQEIGYMSYQFSVVLNVNRRQITVTYQQSYRYEDKLLTVDYIEIYENDKRVWEGEYVQDEDF